MTIDKLKETKKTLKSIVRTLEKEHKEADSNYFDISGFLQDLSILNNAVSVIDEIIKNKENK